VSRARLALAAAVLAVRFASPGAAAAEPTVAVEPDAAPAPDVAAAPPQQLFDLAWDTAKPLSIHSDELEYVRKGMRRLLFRNNVNVEQDGMTIRSARLEAFYPADANQPDRLVAEGDVQLAKGGRKARCARAVYERAREVLTCEGGAEIQQGQSSLRGEKIEIDLATDRVRVWGAASVTLEAGLLGVAEVAEP
jgi:lipopolysaccharide export system protein LptA